MGGKEVRVVKRAGAELTGGKGADCIGDIVGGAKNNKRQERRSIVNKNVNVIISGR